MNVFLLLRWCICPFPLAQFCSLTLSVKNSVLPISVRAASLLCDHLSSGAELYHPVEFMGRQASQPQCQRTRA